MFYIALYLYKNPTYCILYGIIKHYKNYYNWSKMTVYNLFNKIIAKLYIKVKYSFIIYQNFYTWNSFYLILKI